MYFRVIDAFILVIIIILSMRQKYNCPFMFRSQPELLTSESSAEREEI